MCVHEANRSFMIQGLRDAIPIVVAYLPISMTFGVLAASGGIPWPLCILISACIYAGASQFMLISLVSAGASPLSMAITLLLVNLRHFLYGTTLGPAFSSWPERLKWLAAFGLTDEVFAVSCSRALDRRPNPSYQFALILSCYIAWISGTTVGCLAGRAIPNSVSGILQFSLPALFIALLFLNYRKWSSLLAAACGAVLAILFQYLELKSLGIIVGAMVGSAVGTLCSKWRTSPSESE